MLYAYSTSLYVKGMERVMRYRCVLLCASANVDASPYQLVLSLERKVASSLAALHPYWQAAGRDLCPGSPFAHAIIRLVRFEALDSTVH